MSGHDITRDVVSGDGFRDGVLACLPTVLGYWSIGFAAGGIGTLSGFSVPEVTLLAALLYAGSAQFLFYSLALAEVGTLAIVLSVLLVNTRYLLMSSYLSRFFQDKSQGEKFIGGALLTDETFGVAAQRAKGSGDLPFLWLLGLNLTAYVNWVVANLAGAMLAHFLPETLVDSLSFSLTAMFVGLLLLTYFASDTRTLELVAIIVAAAMVVVLFQTAPANIVLLAATVCGALASAILSLLHMYRNRQWLGPFS